MKRVTGIGGIFFKAKDVEKLKQWYVDHLGLKLDKWGEINLTWRERERPERIGHTVFAPFKQDTDYMEPSEKPFMVNFRVDDLEGLLVELRKERVHVIDKVEEFEYGKFGWIMDPEGHKIELWEPPDVDDPFASPDDDGNKGSDESNHGNS